MISFYLCFAKSESCDEIVCDGSQRDNEEVSTYGHRSTET